MSNGNITGGGTTVHIGTTTTGSSGNSLTVSDNGVLDQSAQVVINANNSLDMQSGGTATLDSADTWAGTIHLAAGTLILDSTVQIGTLNQTGGNLVLQGGFLLKLEAGSVMSGGTLAFSGGGNTLELAGGTLGAALDLTTNNTLLLSSGAAATLSNTMTNWAGGSVKLKNGTITSSGFAHNSADGSYNQTWGVLDLTRNADKTPSVLTLTTMDSTITGGTVNIGGITSAADRGNSLTISTNGTLDGVIGLDYAASVTIAAGNTLNVAGGIVNLNGGGTGTDYWHGTVNVSAAAGQGGYLTLYGISNSTAPYFTQDNGTTLLTYSSTLKLGTGSSITGGNVILDATHKSNKVDIASGGTFASNAAITIATGNSFYVTGGTATLNGSGAGSDSWDGAVSLSAGTLTLDSIVQNGTLSQTGGTSTVSGAVTIGTMSGGTANLNGTTSAITTLNGGTLNLGTTALTVSAGTTSGAITGAGGSLIKAGSGTLNLTGTNTYGGATTVTAGTLSVTNPNFCPAAPLSIASGAVLSLSGGGIHKVFALVLGGVPQPEGLYQASNTGGAITGQGVIQVGDAVVTPAYLTWAASVPGLSDTYPTHDPDGDGMTNQQEYAFGLDPNSGASVSPIRVPLVQAGGTFSYSRPDPITTGLGYTVEKSPDLSIWSVDAAATQTVTQTVSGVQTVEVSLSGPKPLTASQLFVRVLAQ